MKPIRCLIVDDEALAREAIRAYVRSDPGLEVVAEAVDGPSAIREIERLRPELLFLDVQMPEVDGFEVLQQVSERNLPLPLTIFVTAYDSHALRAAIARRFSFRFRHELSAKPVNKLTRAKIHFGLRASDFGFVPLPRLDEVDHTRVLTASRKYAS